MWDYNLLFSFFSFAIGYMGAILTCIITFNTRAIGDEAMFMMCSAVMFFTVGFITRCFVEVII